MPERASLQAMRELIEAECRRGRATFVAPVPQSDDEHGWGAGTAIAWGMVRSWCMGWIVRSKRMHKLTTMPGALARHSYR